MLRTKLLPELLQQGDTSGVKGTIILKQEDGSILASTGPKDHCQILAAIVSNVFSQYGAHGALSEQCVYCEEGCLYAIPSHGFLICLFGDTNAQVGMMRKKGALLLSQLDAPLSQISDF